MTRLKPHQRRRQLVSAGPELVENMNLYDVTLSDIAVHCTCSPATVIHYFNSLQGWRDAVIFEAIRHERLKVIAHALMFKDDVAGKLKPDLKERALLSQANP